MCELNTVQLGWICPRCGTSLSPFVAVCPICNGPEGKRDYIVVPKVNNDKKEDAKSQLILS